MLKLIVISFLSFCYCVITWAQFAIIWDSIVSLVGYVLLTVRDFVSPSIYWNDRLLEYWLAGLVWWMTGIWFVLWWYRFFSKNRFQAILARGILLIPSSVAVQKTATFVIGLLIYVSFVCPFLVAIDPNVQGSLASTRLLPPFSKGFVVEVLDPAEMDEGEGTLLQSFRDANNHLLNRRITVSENSLELMQERKATSGEVVRRSGIVFVFGTDDTGRDVFSRMIFGTRVSLGIGVLATLGALLIGSCVGFLAGMSRKTVDSILMRVTDLFLAIPSLFLVIGIMAFLGRGTGIVVVVLALTGWMVVARLVRGEVLSIREKEFILAAKMLQVPSMSIFLRHVLPNVKPVLVTAAVLQFGNTVLAEAALSFLGLGVQPPTATWGNMMGEAMGYLSSAWWLGFFPGALLALLLVALHIVGEGSERNTFAFSFPSFGFETQ